jgi:hypothetical protein
MTPLMTNIQMALTDIVLACLRELKRVYPALTTEALDFERGLVSSFEWSVRSQLDPIWHKLGKRTKQLVFKIDQRRQRQLALRSCFSVCIGIRPACFAATYWGSLTDGQCLVLSFTSDTSSV